MKPLADGLSDEEQAVQRKKQSEVVEKCEADCVQSQENLDRFQGRADHLDVAIAAYGGCLPSVVEHPLLNIHQIVTSRDIVDLGDSKSRGAAAAAGSAAEQKDKKKDKE